MATPMIDKPGQISHESGQGGVSRPNPDKSPGLTPSEIIRLGIEQGHSADVILASLEAAGWVCVPFELPEEPGPFYTMGRYSRMNWLDGVSDALWREEQAHARRPLEVAE